MIRFEFALVVVDGDRRGHAGVRARRAVRGDHHGAAAAGVRAGVVGAAAGRQRSGGLGRGRRRRPVPRRRRAVLHAAARLRRVHAGDHGAAASPSPGAAWDPLLRLAVIAVDLRRHRADRLGPVPAGRRAGHARRHRHRPALPARRRRPADVPDAATSPCSARCAWSARCGWWSTPAARPARARWPSRCSPVYAWSLLSMLTTLVGHHAAVLPAAADADGAADARRARSGSSRRRWPSRRATRPRDRQRVVAARADDRRDRRDDVQPGHPRRAAPRHRRRLHRHRRLRPARRPPAARRRAVLPRDRRQDPRGHRPAAQRDRRDDRRLQLPGLLPVLRVPGPDLALRQPARPVRRSARRPSRAGPR